VIKEKTMELFKEEPDAIEIFDRLILDEQYAEAFAFAIDNGIEREALRICIDYIKDDDERSDREISSNRPYITPDLSPECPPGLLEKSRQHGFAPEYAIRYLNEEAKDVSRKIIGQRYWEENSCPPVNPKSHV
jgi:hypothetical protein